MKTSCSNPNLKYGQDNSITSHAYIKCIQRYVTPALQTEFAINSPEITIWYAFTNFLLLLARTVLNNEYLGICWGKQASKGKWGAVSSFPFVLQSLLLCFPLAPLKPAGGLSESCLSSTIPATKFTHGYRIIVGRQFISNCKAI